MQPSHLPHVDDIKEYDENVVRRWLMPVLLVLALAAFVIVVAFVWD